MIASPRRFHLVSGALACLLLAAPLGLAACGSDAPDITKSDAASTVASTTVAPTSTTTTTTPEPATRSWIANVKPEVGSIIVADSPAGAQLQLDTSGTGDVVKVAVDNPLPSGAPTTFLVTERNVEARGQLWHEVLLPVRPNGSTGWISSGDVTLTHTDMAATIRLGTLEMELRDGGEVVATYPVAIGLTSTPTPIGNFYVKELLQPTPPNGAYGPLAYGLSAHSDVLIDTEAFADGVIGIHGTNKPELIGTVASNGCVRMNNDDVLDLERREVPLGMPVTIVA